MSKKNEKHYPEPVPPRIKIRFSKTEHCIVIRTFSRGKYERNLAENKKYGYAFKPNSGSSNFYVTKESIKTVLIPTGSLIAKDCRNFCKINIFNTYGKAPYIDIEFTWLEGNDIGCRGYIERLSVDYDAFMEFLNDEEMETITLLNVEDELKPKIHFQSAANLSNVIRCPVVRKKFSRAMMWMQNKQCEVVKILDDLCNEFSFYFCTYSNYEFIYNGGLIFHKDHKSPENLGKGKYGIHT